MNDLEQYLKCLPLAAPSADMDRRLGDEFAADRNRKQSRATTIWWSLAAITTIGFAAALLVMRSAQPPSPAPPLIYRFEARGQLRQLLLEPPASKETKSPILVRTIAS
jgi:hypothetical protein